MKRTIWKLVTWISLGLCIVGEKANAKPLNLFGDALLRYENEYNHAVITDRERLRLIARLGAEYRLNDDWQLIGRLSTGLKNKQNVPAVTVYKFNEQPTPDSDVFLERLYIKGSIKKATITAGKLPWQSWQVTDTFWDRQLAPYGIDMRLPAGNAHTLYAMYSKPLDGNKDTVGNLFVGQWQYRREHNGLNITVAPWLVSYKGEEGAMYAQRDTKDDNLFARLSVQLNYGKLSFGADIGQSLSSFAKKDFQEFADQKQSFAVQVGYGKLKSQGDYQTHLRYLHVERFGVITEFAQNAVARFATSNLRGWDVRIRRKMSNSAWLNNCS